MSVKRYVWLIVFSLLVACSEQDTEFAQLNQKLANFEVRNKECSVLEDEEIAGEISLPISRDSLHAGLWYFHIKNSNICLGTKKSDLLALSKNILHSESASITTRQMAKGLIELANPQGVGLGLKEAKFKFDALSDFDRRELLALSIANRPFNVIAASQYYKVDN